MKKLALLLVLVLSLSLIGCDSKKSDTKTTTVVTTTETTTIKPTTTTTTAVKTTRKKIDPNEFVKDVVARENREYKKTWGEKEKARSKSNKSYVVYITEKGTKYHKKGCSYLRKSCIEANLDEAVADGYTPCSRCNP
ncbi:MAG: hypothetical protein IJO19_04300 [Clostridia bacterium]|nr:hypothetical protein [Clostridia bacterium]